MLLKLIKPIGPLVKHADASYFLRLNDISASVLALRLASGGTSSTRLPKGYNAPSAYILFNTENLKKHGPVEKVTEVAKESGAKWKVMSESEKKPFVDESNKIALEKKAEFDKLTDDEKYEILRESVKRKDNKKRILLKREKKKFYVETNRPKKPLSSFMIFVIDVRSKEPQLNGKKAILELGQKAGEKWKAMSEDEKKVYHEKWMATKEKYTQELAQWKSDNMEAIKQWEEKRHGKAKKAAVKKARKVGRKPKSVKANAKKVVAKGLEKKKVLEKDSEEKLGTGDKINKRKKKKTNSELPVKD